MAALRRWSVRNIPCGIAQAERIQQQAENVARTHGPALDAEETDALVERLSVDWSAPVESLKGTVPLVLYFQSDRDADELVQILKDAKPNLVTQKLPR